MAKPWQTIEKVDTPDGILELRRRGERDFLILINNRVLMNSAANRSETALGRDACRMMPDLVRPRVLIGGLGMGLTLRAALDTLPGTAAVVVAELNPVVVQWCRGPLSGLNKNAIKDQRVNVVMEDVSKMIAKPGSEQYNAIIIDLYEGPGGKADSLDDPFYGSRALDRTFSGLLPGGIFAVWGENPDAAFEKRLAAAGFSFNRQRPGRGGLRHVVYLAQRKA